MIQSKLKITFGQELIVGSNIIIKDTNIIYTYDYTTAPTPTVNIGEATALLFAGKFEIDNPTYNIEVFTTPTSTSVVITAPSAAVEFVSAIANYNEFERPAFVSFEITRQEGINIVGLNGNNFLINNDIILEINAVEPVDFYRISFSNLSNQKSTLPFIVYPIDNKCTVNIAPIVKSLFSNVTESNQNFIIIEIQGGGQTTSVVKNFIRGGKRNQLTNQTVPSNSVLRSSARLPIWDGYQTMEYFADGNGLIKTRTIDELTLAQKEYKRVKSCDPLYLRFLNSKGGYSNWLFEDWEEQQNSKGLGGYNGVLKMQDLGSETDFSIVAKYKVDAEYIGILQDLIDSPEIYANINGLTERLLNDKNNLSLNKATKVYSGSFNFKKLTRYNPSVLFSN